MKPAKGNHPMVDRGFVNDTPLRPRSPPHKNGVHLTVDTVGLLERFSGLRCFVESHLSQWVDCPSSLERVIE